MTLVPPTRADLPLPSQTGMDALLEAVLQAVAQDGVKVPPMPIVVAKLAEHLANPSCEMRDVVQLVGTDQALSAHILRCAKSGLTPTRTQVGSLSEAVMRVGTNGLFSLSVSFHMGREISRSTPLQSLRRDVFRRAAANAEFCRRLAGRRAADPEGAFLCGLLSSFGLNVALGAIEQAVEAGHIRQSRPAETWMEMARACETQIGPSVAAQWGMPKLVSDVIAARLSKAEPDPAVRPYLELLQMADALTDIFYRVPAPGEQDIIKAIQCNQQQAAEIAAFLPEVAASVWALGLASDDLKLTQTIQIQMVESPASTLRGDLISASIPVTVERKGGDQQLVCVGLAADGFVAHGTKSLPLNQVVKCRLTSADENFELVAFVAAVNKETEYRFEMKPMGLSGPNARKWQKLRDAAAKEASANEGLDAEVTSEALAEPPTAAPEPIDLDPLQPKPAANQPAGARQGGYVSVHTQRSPFRRLGSWLKGRGDG